MYVKKLTISNCEWLKEMGAFRGITSQKYTSRATTKYYKWYDKTYKIQGTEARDIFCYLKVHTIAVGKSSINTIVTRYSKQEDKRLT